MGPGRTIGVRAAASGPPGVALTVLYAVAANDCAALGFSAAAARHAPGVPGSAAFLEAVASARAPRKRGAAQASEAARCMKDECADDGALKV